MNAVRDIRRLVLRPANRVNKTGGTSTKRGDQNGRSLNLPEDARQYRSMRHLLYRKSITRSTSKLSLVHSKAVLDLFEACVFRFRIDKKHQEELHYHHGAEEDEWIGPRAPSKDWENA